MQPRILFAFPGALVKSALWDMPEVVLFDDTGWWVKESGSADRRCFDTFSFAVTWTPENDPVRLLSVFKEWSPVWSRWVAHADQYELLYREAFIYVSHIRAALRALEIKHAVFHTGLSHHIDSSLLEIACADAQVLQTFLYANTVDGRLLPLRQARSSEDRRPLGAVVSEHQASDGLRLFRENTLARRPPPIGFFDGWLLRSPLMAVLDGYYLVVRRRLSRLRRFASGRRSATAEFLDQFPELGPREFRRLIAGQKKALAYLERKLVRGPLNDALVNLPEPAILLAAHYQPEASSFPEGGGFHNHLDLVIKLRGLGYSGPILYKEHLGSTHYVYPIIHQTRVGMARSLSYYRRLEELGCIFVDPRTPVPIEPSVNDKFVPMTITGSIALERSLLGLKTIVAGYPWYRGLPATASLFDLESLATIGDSMLGVDSAEAEEAFAYMDQMLSKRTIINAPGIGAGDALTDAASKARFARELHALLEQL